MKNAPALPARRKQETLRIERIGQTVRVLDSSCKAERDLHGAVVDETKFTFLIQTPRGRRRVPKAGRRFAFPFGTLVGDDIVHAPSERLKRR